ncbi:MAG: CHAD domain-containing protein [Verrucomicrobiaceae bacterium]|nr:CHAD domain-containing protein [Verrucomicrobiaceae bacterium]
MKSARTIAPAASGKVLRHLLTGLLDTAQRDVARLSTHEAVATHQLRVRMKKLLSLLRLGQDALPEPVFEAMRMHIRAVKNACSARRDRQVRQRLLTKLSRRFHLPLPPQPHRTLRMPAAPSATFLRHQLCALEQLLETTRIDTLSPEQVLAAHALSYRKGRRLMKQAFESTQEDILHRWRHRVKDLHYQTLALSHMPGATRRVRRSRKLGAILGRERDLGLLAHDRLCASPRSAWHRLIHECRSRLRDRLLLLGRKLYDPAAHSFSQKMRRQAIHA